jgi:epoxyqueuosine reductase QueG
MRSGVGSVGWSGNIGLKGYGAAIILGGLVTSAKLEPTDPIPEEESFCNKCKLCTKVCAFRMFSDRKEDSITLGGFTFKFAKRINLARCQIVCGGLSGLDKSGKWSTWSPGRYSYPETDKEVMRTLNLAVNNFLKWPEIELHKKYDTSEFANDKEITEVLGDIKFKMLKMIEDVKLTCGNCQLICTGDPKETNENYKLLINSGCVVQKEDGKIVILSPVKAQEVFNAMDPKHQRLYYKKIKRAT